MRMMLGMLFLSSFLFQSSNIVTAQDELPARVMATMRKATEYFRGKVAVRGGYVYTYSLDLRQREGEGEASPTEIWIQPPGTPTVGQAYLHAYEVTGEKLFLDAARETAGALIWGQLASGGWTDSIEFDPQGKRANLYRNGQGRAKGRNYSTLDDDKTQSALCFLMQLDRVLAFQDKELHETTQFALKSLLAAQFPNGGFPQGWRAPASAQPIVPASYPEYDWRTENRIKEYWDYYTLNDGLAGTVARTLHQAHQIYGDAAYRTALLRLGDFLLLAQMPEPQPAWAQQYNFQMHPMWARRFEPPAISGSESEDVIETLLFLYQFSGDRKYLNAVGPALAWLKRSELPDGQLARFYELKTNRPLYLTRDTYQLTYDDDQLPTHYSFKKRPKRAKLEQLYLALQADQSEKPGKPSLKSLQTDAERIVSELDKQGRWLATSNRKPYLPESDSLSDKQRMEKQIILSSELFCKNLNRLSDYISATQAKPGNRANNPSRQ